MWNYLTIVHGVAAYQVISSHLHFIIEIFTSRDVQLSSNTLFFFCFKPKSNAFPFIVYFHNEV